MLNLPIYLLGSSYYLHTRIAGKQVKRSLRTGYQRIAIMRAIALLNTMHKKPDLSNLSTYEIDISKGIFKANGDEDQRNMMETLKAIQAGGGLAVPQPAIAPAVAADDPTALKLGELLEKFLLLNKLARASVKSYKYTTQDFSKFLHNPPITRVTVSDVTRYQEHLAKGGNGKRTIDGKIAIISSQFSFAKEQGYTRGDNPAANRSKMSKKEKLRDGYAILERDEIEALLQCNYFKVQQVKDPDYINTLMMALFTGCRVSEITTLKKSQFKTSPLGIPYITIRDSKTAAGIREIPLHPYIHTYLAKWLAGKTDKVFRFLELDGKGSGNAVGKKFATHRTSAKLTRKKIVFHSLRKFVNNEFLKGGVSIEQRCQFIGHELDNVNVTTYANSLSVDALAGKVFPVLSDIETLVRKSIEGQNAIDLSSIIEESDLI